MSCSKVLLVDDEDGVLKAICRLLRKESFEIVTTNSPEEALQFVTEEIYAVVISDQRMPTLSGTELLANVREVAPDTVRIILTGYVDIQTTIDAINQGEVYHFIPKPWNDKDLCITIRQAVAKFEMTRENKRLHELTKAQNRELKALSRDLEKRVSERTNKITSLNRQLDESFLGAIHLIANLAEMHSPVIGNHAKRTAALCKGTAQYLGMPEQEIREIEIAAILHDIGKIGISPHILRKSENARSRYEVEMVRRHVICGEQIIGMIPNVGDAPRLVRHHHERFDGTGYPDRLKGRHIPTGARLIAIADGYDNALNKRQNFQTAAHGTILEYVQNRCPREFDPDLMAAFTDFLSEHRRILGATADMQINLRDLQEGMMLSRELRTAKGILLLPKGSRIGKPQLERIQNFHESDPILSGIYIYRRKPISRSRSQRNRIDY